MKKTALYILALFPFACLGQAGGISGPGSGSMAQGSLENMQKIIPASPTVASLMKLEEIPVDNYSGTPGISIPLHSLGLDGGLSLDVGLSYSTTGLRVDDIPGWAGAGWSLSCGGSISRTMLDRPDDKQFGILLNGFENLSGMSKYDSEEFLWKATRFQWDTEPDLFQFNFMGKTGRFILRKDAVGSVIVQDLTGEGQRQITVKMGIRDEVMGWIIQAFEITDDMGYIYTFDITDFTTARSEDFATSDFYNSAWHLTKIQSPDHRVLCSFTYQAVQETYITPKSVTYNEVINNRPPAPITGQPMWPILPSVVSSFTRMQVNSSVPRSVEVPGKGSIWFTKETRTQPFEDPLYSYQGYKLSSIEVRNAAGAAIKNYVFNTDSNITHGYKLFLNSIDEIYSFIPLKKYTYTMAYKLGDIPKYGSLKKDYWGYYNGADNQTLAPLLGANREVNTTTIQNGVLQSIAYTNGGTKRFVFQPNTFSYIGKRLLDLLDPDEFPENRNFMPQAVSYSSNTPVPKNTIITIDKEQFVTFRLKADTYNASHKNDVAGTDLRIIHLSSANGVPLNVTDGILNIAQCSAYGSSLDQNHTIEVTECSKTVKLTPGTYNIQLGQTTTGYLASFAVGYKLTFNYFNMAATYKMTSGGGLRILKTELWDGTVPKSGKRYSYDEPGGTGYSSGSQSMVAKKLPYYLNKSMFIPDPSDPPGAWNLFAASTTYRVFDDQSGLDLPLTKGNYVAYRNISVRDYMPGPYELDLPESYNGWTKYTYTSMQDFDDNGNLEDFIVGYPYIRPPSYDYKRGLLKKKEIYDNSGRLLYREFLDYIYNGSIAEFGFAMRQKADCDCPPASVFIHYDDIRNYMIWNYRHLPEIGEALLTESQAIELYNQDWAASEFSSGGHKVSDCIFTRRYQWLIPNKYVVGWAALSEKRTETHRYDTTGTETILEGKQTFIYNGGNQQIARENTILSPTETLTTAYYYAMDVLSASSLPGGTIAAGDLAAFNTMRTQLQYSVPVQTQTLRNSAVLSTERTVYQQLGLGKLTVPRAVQVSRGSGALEDRLYYTNVDPATANVIETVQDGRTTRYVWGYRQQFPIAKIEYYGTLTMPEALFAAATLASDGIDPAAFTNVLTGIRNALPGAMVTTYTYIPWIGMTSITDPNGHTALYDYDEFFRLKSVKDADKTGNLNMLSSNQYNYRTNP